MKSINITRQVLLHRVFLDLTSSCFCVFLPHYEHGLNLLEPGTPIHTPADINFSLPPINKAALVTSS